MEIFKKEGSSPNSLFPDKGLIITIRKHFSYFSNTLNVEQAVGLGVIKTFSTCAVKHKMNK